MIARFLSWRWSRTLLQLPLFAVSVAMIVHGFWGPQLAPKNLATVLTWVHYRGILVVALLACGNLFCLACPFMLVRDFLRRFVKPVLRWPHRLRNKWLAVGLFVAVLFGYELFDLWGSPRWTAGLIAAYFVGALVVDSLFKRASFCKWVCPIGQFNFVAATVSPLEVTVRDTAVCAHCETLDCIRGTRAAEDRTKVVQRGCELALFQPKKTGNMDCTFCLDCVYACPHENVGFASRLPASELWIDPRRSGVGYFSKRKDLAALALVFAFGSLVNAFGMVSPIYAVEEWISRLLGTTHETPVLGTLFLGLLVIEPALLLGLAAWLSRRGAGTKEPLLAVVTRYAWTLVPLGFGVWLAHYCFHLITGLLTFIPVTQEALAEVGFPITPNWRLSGVPVRLVDPLQLGFLVLGLAGALLVAWRLAERERAERPLPVFLPWAGLAVVLFGAALWLMAQPMEMRGTFLGA